MIEELTGNETAVDFTADLRERLTYNEPYDDNIPAQLHPLEPYVLVDAVIDGLTNYRAFNDKDGNLIIPIATYIDCGNGKLECRSNRTMFDECVEFSDVYGIDAVNVAVLSTLRVEDTEI